MKVSPVYETQCDTWPGYCLRHLLQANRWQWTSSRLRRLERNVWWCFTDSVDHLSIHDSLFSTCAFSPNCGLWRAGVGARKAVIMWRMNIRTECMKRSGLGTYCASNMTETLEWQQWWKPCILNTALSDCRRKLSAQTPKPYRPSLLLTLRLALLWLIVTALQTLHSLLPWGREQKEEWVRPGFCKQKASLFFLFPVLSLRLIKVLCVLDAQKNNEEFILLPLLSQ